MVGCSDKEAIARLAWLSDTIDGISRQLGRDVTYLRFDWTVSKGPIKQRVREITQWLDKNEIKWRIVTEFDPKVVWVEGGPWCIFLNVAKRGPKMKLLKSEFVKSDKSPRINGVFLETLSFAEAIEHSERDDDEF